MSEHYWEEQRDNTWLELARELHKNALADIGFLLSHIETLNLMTNALRSENENYRAALSRFKQQRIVE